MPASERPPPQDLTMQSSRDIDALNAALADFGFSKIVPQPASGLIVVTGPQPVITHHDLDRYIQHALGIDDAPAFCRPTDRYGDTDAAIRLRAWLVAREAD